MEEKIPSRVYLDVTAACQLRCRHCCTDSTSKLDKELGREEIFAVLDQVKQLGVTQLVISGGEPLLRPELSQILFRARELALTVTLLTNGLLIDETWARLFTELGIRVKVSLDGARAGTHDFLRGRGTFEKTVEVLRRLIESGADTAVHYTVHRKNFLELTELPGLLASLNVKNLVIGTIKPAGRAKTNVELLIPPRMVPFVHAQVEAVKRRARLRILNFSDRGWGEFGCPATCNKLGLTADGYLTSCAFFGREFLGDNIRKFSLAELWRRHLERREFSQAGKTCRHCPALSACAGGCRARALFFNGDISAPDPYACALQEKKRFIDANRSRLLRARQNFYQAFA
jgi:radical SAM protein with 4Fe4S-binding SPASM domain